MLRLHINDIKWKKQSSTFVLIHSTEQEYAAPKDNTLSNEFKFQLALHIITLKQHTKRLDCIIAFEPEKKETKRKHKNTTLLPKNCKLLLMRDKCTQEINFITG